MSYFEDANSCCRIVTETGSGRLLFRAETPEELEARAGVEEAFLAVLMGQCYKTFFSS